MTIQRKINQKPTKQNLRETLNFKTSGRLESYCKFKFLQPDWLERSSYKIK